MSGSVVDKLDTQEQRIKNLETALRVENEGKNKKWRIKIPNKILRKLKKTQNSSCLWLGHNSNAEFRLIEFKDGLLWQGKNSYAYERGAVYNLKQGRKRVPLVVVYEERLLPVGGKAEEYRSRLVGDEFDHELAEALQIKNIGQQTIIRAIEQAEIDKDKKKTGGLSIIWIILLVVGALYLISQIFGFGG